MSAPMNVIKDIYKVICGFVQETKENNMSSFAAAAAFFVFLSIVPMMIIVCSMLAWLDLSPEVFFFLGQSIMPVESVELLRGVANEFKDHMLTTISLSAFITLWLAGNGVSALSYGLNSVHHVVDKKNFVVLRIMSSIYTIIFILMLSISLGILVMGNRINEMLETFIPPYHFAIAFIMRFRFLFVWVFLVIMFQVLYTVLPSVKVRYKMQFPGAMFASMCWSVISWVFSKYIDQFDGFAFYGSFSTTVVTMAWLYFCMYAVLLGAQINIFFSPVFKRIEQAGSNKKKVQQTGKEAGKRKHRAKRRGYIKNIKNK